jgi:hypothetical protein
MNGRVVLFYFLKELFNLNGISDVAGKSQHSDFVLLEQIRGLLQAVPVPSYDYKLAARPTQKPC